MERFLLLPPLFSKEQDLGRQEQPIDDNGSRRVSSSSVIAGFSQSCHICLKPVYVGPCLVCSNNLQAQTVLKLPNLPMNTSHWQFVNRDETDVKLKENSTVVRPNGRHLVRREDLTYSLDVSHLTFCNLKRSKWGPVLSVILFILITLTFLSIMFCKLREIEEAKVFAPVDNKTFELFQLDGFN